MITAYLKSIFVLALRVMCGTLLVRVWQDKGVIICMALVVEGREFKWYEEVGGPMGSVCVHQE